MAKNFKEVNINFNLRTPSDTKPSAIKMVLRWQNQTLTFYSVSPYPILATQWNKESQTAKKNFDIVVSKKENKVYTYTDLNKHLATLKTSIIEAFRAFTKEHDAYPVANEMKNIVNEIIAPKDLTEQIENKAPELGFIAFAVQTHTNRKNGTERIKSGKNKGKLYKLQTIKNIKTVIETVKRYAKHKKKKDFTFAEINSEAFYNDFMNFVYKIENKEISTFSTLIKEIKSIIYHNGQTPNRNLIKPDYEADTIALSEAQVNALHSVDLSAQPDYLANARDLFLVGCYTALRYSNYSTIKLENIEGNFIRVQQVKTGDRVTIPVISKLREIIDRNNGNLPHGISNQKLNAYIKEVAKIAGLTEILEIKNTKGGQTNIEKKPLYECISTHTARRTYATMLFKKGVPPMLIMSATGHKTQSSFIKYVRATDESKAQLLANELSNLGL